MRSALEIAAYILRINRQDQGDLISNLKLQKLLYYSQGIHLALNGKPLFSEEILHWNNGPVVKEVYDHYKEYKSNALPPPDCPPILDEKERESVDKAYDTFGQFSAWKLVEMTHEEIPWKNTVRDETISNDSIKKYFEINYLEETRL